MLTFSARKTKKGVAVRFRWPAFAGICFVVIFSLYITFLRQILQSNGELLGEAGRSNAKCLGWRHTRSCTPYGVRDVSGDKDCQAWISRQSGYCQCDHMVTVKRVSCGRYRPFRCDMACATLGDVKTEAELLPDNVTCPAQGQRDSSLVGAATGWLHRSSGVTSNRPSTPTTRALDAKAAGLWTKVHNASSLNQDAAVRLPESRTVNMDWVRDGVHMRREDIRAIRAQWQAFAATSPEFPADMFHGKGIVILAGGLTYMVPAWVNVHMLRRTGCTLPVEMFFPGSEFPSLLLEDALAELGVTCRRLPELESSQDAIGSQSAPINGFTLKIAALILSQYEEVLFLDSDNVPVANPAILFEAQDYLKTGALLWPDYWQSSAAPDLAEILGVHSLQKGTFESGQMVFNKRRSWKGLMLAAFFNMQSELYYELFSNYMGKGDKESFAHALQAMGIPFSVVKSPVGSVGEIARQCYTTGTCEDVFLGNTMAQYSTDGDVMFLHANLSPKWNLQIPGNFSSYRRRWKVILPGEHNVWETIGDLEQDVYRVLVAFRCSGFLPSYLEKMALESESVGSNQLPVGLQGFHPQNPGIEFRQAYRWGLSGPYLRIVKVKLVDIVFNFFNTKLKSQCFYCWRIVLRCMSNKNSSRHTFVIV